MAKDAPDGADDGAVTAVNAGQEVLQQFWDLASLDPEVRAKAVQSLTAALLADQAAHAPPAGAVDDAPPKPAKAGGGGGGDAAALAAPLRRCSPTMAYALKRLARGLASGRDGARQGYASALTVLLAAAAAAGGGGKKGGKAAAAGGGGGGGWLELGGALQLLEGSLPVTGSMKGSDQRDALLGRVFGLAALARSGLASPSAPAAARAAEQLCALSARKVFLRESAAAALLELLEGLPPGVAVGDVIEASPALRALLLQPAASAPPEALLLALRLWGRLPPPLRSRCELLPAGAPPPPPGVWARGAAPGERAGAEAAAAALLSRTHLSALGPALAASSAAAPRLHGVWGCLLALLLPGFNPGGRAERADAGAAPQARAPADPALVAAFWSAAVEGPLLGGGSHERRALALTLLQLMLPWLTPEAVPAVLGGRVVGLLAGALRDKKSYLHASAKRCAERIATLGERSGGAGEGAAAGDAALRLALAAALQGGPGGGGGFDAHTGTKTVARLLAGLDAAGVESYVDRLLATFQAPGGGAGGDEDESDDEGEGEGRGGGAAEAARGRALEQLSAALRFPAAGDGLVGRGLAALAAVAFLDVAPGAAAGGGGGKKKKSKESGGGDVAAALAVVAGAAAHPLSPRVRGLCAARLVTLLHSAAHRQVAPAAGGAPAGAGKKERAAAAAAATAAAAEAARAQQEELLSGALSFLERAQAAEGVSLAKPLEPVAAAALAGLRSLCAALAAPAARKDGKDGKDAAAARARALLQLARLLQLQLLSDPAAFDARLVPDLMRVALEGAGATTLAEEVAAAAAAATAGEDSGSGSDEEGGGGGAPPHWADLLLDVLLALLSAPGGGGGGGGLPSAPLREAAEALFRASADELTAAGLQDLLRVLCQRPDEGGLLQEGDDDDDSEVEQDEEGGSGDDDEGSEEEAEEGSEEEEEGSEEEEEDKEEAGREAGAKARGGGGGSEDGDEEEESEDTGMDDEAMLRLDSQLGAYVKSMLARGGASGRERAAALRGLQLRAAALLEEWLRRCPRSPLAATAAAGPLLRALAAAARPGGSPPLAERLRGLAAGRLAKCRPELAGGGGEAEAEAEALRGAMKAALYYASRERDARVAGAAAAVLPMLLAAAGGPSAPPAARAAAAEYAAAAAADLVSKKKSRLGRGGLEAVLSRAPHAALGAGGAGGETALAVLARAAAAGRTDFVRAEALELLASAVSKAPPELAGAALRGLLQRGPGGGGGSAAAALVSGAQGPFKTKERHAAAAKAAVALVEAAKKLLPPGGRLGELLGPDALTGTAKAVAAARALGVPPRVEAQLARLVEAAGLQQLAASAAARPDPARLAALKKQRAALAAGGAAGAKRPAPGGGEGGGGKKAKGAAGGGGAAQKRKGGAAAEQGSEEEGGSEEEEEASSSGDEDMGAAPGSGSGDDSGSGGSDEGGSSEGGGSSEDEEEEEDRRPAKGKPRGAPRPQGGAQKPRQQGKGGGGGGGGKPAKKHKR
ncbi:MAG: DNA polymerase phi-domain-containing protein [Monoraphidium minutum]|nr:MAG: DNA polymerase phi-domain-containing protein [Monoraphidium minutum]